MDGRTPSRTNSYRVVVRKRCLFKYLARRERCDTSGHDSERGINYFSFWTICCCDVTIRLPMCLGNNNHLCWIAKNTIEGLLTMTKISQIGVRLCAVQQRVPDLYPGANPNEYTRVFLPFRDHEKRFEWDFRWPAILTYYVSSSHNVTDQNKPYIRRAVALWFVISPISLFTSNYNPRISCQNSRMCLVIYLPGFSILIWPASVCMLYQSWFFC